MRCFALIVMLPLCPVGLRAVPLQQADTAAPHPDSATAPVPPPPLTPAQDRYLDGLKTAGRGVAQLKDGINQVARATGSHDSTKLRQAGHRLGGLCGAARGFLSNGRASMNSNVFSDERHKPARDLALRVDSLTAGTRACEHAASRDPTKTTNDLLTNIRSYEEALAAFRTSIGLPNKAPTPPASLPPHKP